jgi:hypothetical protein
MSMNRPRLLLLPVLLAPVAAAVFLVHCIDGTTPNCAGDAGCGPGVEAGDAPFDVADSASDAAQHDAAPDVAPVTPDAAPDVTPDVHADAPVDAPVDVTGG